LLFFTQANSQSSNTKVIYKTDTIYYDQDWEKTSVKEDYKFARIIKRTLDRKPYGTVCDYYYPSWKKQWEGKLISENPDIAQGFCTFWFPNGQIQSSGTYL